MQSTKIAIIIDTLNGGGAEKVCLTLTKAMTEKGVAAHLIVLKKKCDYDLPKNINVHFIFSNPKIKLYRRSNQIEAARRLNALSARVGGFEAHFSNLDECHPIVARANLPNTFYVLHNSIENILKRTSKLGPLKYWRKWRSFNNLNNKDLIAVSKGVNNEIRTTGRIKAKSITTIYNPLDINEINIQAMEEEPDLPDKPYIIYVGRVAEQKRVDILLEAFKYVKHDVLLVMLGSESKKLDRIISRSRSKRDINTQPFKQNPYPWIKHAKALVLSSDYEGFGMVLVEALACGTPAASVECPHGPKEILSGSLGKFLAPTQKPKILAEKIDNAIENREAFQNPPILKEVALEKVVEQYLDKAKLRTTITRPHNNKITFYLPNYDKLSFLDQIDPYLAWQEMPRGEGFWILQTYCFLKHFGVDVRISKTLPDEGILIFHRRNKNSLFNENKHKVNKLILVGCRGDLHDILVPDFELLQNNFFADGERKFAMPHWPMPNIKPRNPERENKIKRIAFKGFAAQLHPDFQTQEWKEFLIQHNIEWVQNAVNFTHDGKSTFDDSVWSDYSDIDLVIAVRPERNDLHTNKPALKLYNAWIAGVPAILGKECAYREIGSRGEDYIEVNSLEDAKRAITQLIETPEAYQTMIERGQQKAHLYSHEAVCEAWKHFLYQILPDKVEKRQKQISYRISRYFSLNFRYRCLFMWKWLTMQRMR